MTTVILFVFGAIIGSFLNVVGLRWNSGRTLGGRSHCASCGRTLGPHDLVPIVSYLLLRGRCSGCKSKISSQYLLVELWTGLIFVTLYFVAGLTPYFLLLTTVFCIYIVITIYDLHHKIIPDQLVYLAIILSFLTTYYPLPTTNLFDWLAGPLLFLFFASIWFLSHGRAMGFGDAKLALSIGLLLGAALGFSAVIIAFWIGAAWGLSCMIFSHKKITMKSEIPFAPFLVLGAWVSLVLELDLLHVSLF